MATPTESPNKVFFGENKAISALTFEHENGLLELGAIFHIPTRQVGGKTFYKPIACKITISDAQREHLIKMLGGFTI
jgi:hypothetical protein